MLSDALVCVRAFCDIVTKIVEFPDAWLKEPVVPDATAWKAAASPSAHNSVPQPRRML